MLWRQGDWGEKCRNVKNSRPLRTCRHIGSSCSNGWLQTNPFSTRNNSNHVPNICLWTGEVLKVLTTSNHGLSTISREFFERCPINKTGFLKGKNSKFFLPLSLVSVWPSLSIRFSLPLMGVLCKFLGAVSWPFTDNSLSSRSTGIPKSIKHIALKHTKNCNCQISLKIRYF